MSVSSYVDNAQEQFLQQLREATGMLHKRLEVTPLSMSLMEKNVSIADYGAYLQHMRNVIAYCELHVFPIISHLYADIDERRKLKHIEHDICVLEKDTHMRPVAPYHASVSKEHIPFALGYMYVIEGSTLGGRMLLSHIGHTLGYNAEAGASFFAGYGPLTGKRWKEFLETFCNYATLHNCTGEIIAGSKYAFESIEEYFTGK